MVSTFLKIRVGYLNNCRPIKVCISLSIFKYFFHYTCHFLEKKNGVRVLVGVLLSMPTKVLRKKLVLKREK